MATVENPGATETTESVEFRVGGTVVDREWVTVGPREQATVHFEADTTGLAAGEYIHGVLTDRDGAFATLDISESFTVENLTAPANATSGENVSVTATVANPNEMNATQHVSFRFNGGLLAQEPVTLGPNETSEVTFNTSLAGVAEGDYVHGVFTRDSGQLAMLSVEESNETLAPATVNFSDQSSDGTMVTIDSATVPAGGFLVIHDETLLDGNVLGSVIGVSEPLEPGSYENVSVTLFNVAGGPGVSNLTEDATLIAMPHYDTNGNNIYDFVRSGGMDDGPYVDNGSAVVDAANITVGTTAPNETETPPAETPGNETTGNETTGEETTEEETSDTEAATSFDEMNVEVLLPGAF